MIEQKYLKKGNNNLETWVKEVVIITYIVYIIRIVRKSRKLIEYQCG